MKSSFRTLVERLRSHVLSRPKRVFDEGRRRWPELAGHPDAASVLGVLANDAESGYRAREALTRALLFEHRRSGNAYWASLLVVAFYPMLIRLRARLVCEAIPNEDLDQLVISSFLSALDQLQHRRRPEPIALRLRLRTKRLVFRCLRAEREYYHTSFEPEDSEEADSEASVHHRVSTGECAYDLALVLKRAASEGVPAVGFDVVEATVLRREPLRKYVERVGPQDSVQRERMYQRLKRQRTRALRRLKTFFFLVSPHRFSGGFAEYDDQEAQGRTSTKKSRTEGSVPRGRPAVGAGGPRSRRTRGREEGVALTA